VTGRSPPERIAQHRPSDTLGPVTTPSSAPTSANQVDIFEIIAVVLLVAFLVTMKRWIGPALVETLGIPGALLIIAGCYWLAVWMEKNNA
jgi:hypothetical protein